MKIERPFPIIGIGASAGGYEAFVKLLQALPGPIGAAFVFIQHLDPTHESMLVPLLSRVTSIPVGEATGGTKVQPDRIYISPPGAETTIQDGALKVGPPKTPRHMRLPVDVFFRSLAEDRGSAAIGVILSGTGTDGTLGLRQIKEDGGIGLVQDPATAKFAGMPQSAIAETAVDFTLPPEGIAHELARLAEHPYVRSAVATPTTEPPAQPSGEESLGQIVALLKAASGVDFSIYKQTTIVRRTVRRMTLLGKEDLAEYVKHCEAHGEELEALYHDLLIKVTSFFREPESFEVLKQTVFPALFENRSSDGPFRVWVPGCSSGEEAYSIAMVLFEFLAERQLAAPPPIQIFATDVDESILEKARRGAYVENVAVDISPDRLGRFFTRVDHTYRVTKQLREVCTFARHNLLTDPPFSNLDLISCRNLFIYLDLPAQRRVVPKLHYALRPGGYLTLGPAESITADDMFSLVDTKYKVYVRQGGDARLLLNHLGTVELGTVEPFVTVPARSNPPGSFREGTVGSYDQGVDPEREANRILLGHYQPVGVLVDEHMKILQYRGDTSPYLAPPPGRASLNLLSMAREGLLHDLRAATEEAKATNQVAVRETVSVTTFDGTLLDVTVRVIPARKAESNTQLYMVLFEDSQTASSRRRRRPARKAAGRTTEDQTLLQVRDDLDATKAYLQSVIEDRDTAIEELRSSNEEVLSANEELQSTNEELETAKEELQSTNEELITSNEEVQRHNRELERRNDDLHNLFNSSHLPIVLLGEDLRIRQFSAVARRVLNVIPADVGRPITDLRMNIRTPDLEALLRRVIAGGRPIEREVQNEEGDWYLLRVTPYMTSENQISGAVLLLVDIGAVKDVDRLTSLLKERDAARIYAESIVETVRHPILILDAELRVKSANHAFYDIFNVSPEETLGGLVYETGSGQWGIPGMRHLLKDVLPREKAVDDVEVTQEFPRIGLRTVHLNARTIEYVDDAQRPSDLILLAIEDVTERKRTEDSLREADRQKSEFLAMLSHELRNPLAPIHASVELLRSNKADASAEEALVVLERQVATLTRLINDLLEVSRVTTGKIHLQQTDCDLNALVQRSVDTSSPQIATHGHNLSLSLPDPPVWVHADVVRMEQVLVNLLTNAVKYTPDGGHIWLIVERDNEEAVVRVRDSGAGIEPDLLPRLFDLFSQGPSTLARSEAGLGIGLALVKSLVELHGGTVTVGSEGPGKGSEFAVRLPTVPAPPSEAATSVTSDGDVAGADQAPSLRVLVVDDNADMTRVSGMLLRRSGHQVRTANTGQEALEAALQFRPQVMLLDIGLPDIDGYEVARRVREAPALKDVVLVSMTGYGRESDRQRSREAGFDHHLVKPAGLDDLLGILSSIKPLAEPALGE